MSEFSGDPRDIPPDNPKWNWFFRSPRSLNQRVQAIFEGYGDFGVGRANDVLIALLKSDFELTRETRDLLIDALRRGQGRLNQEFNEDGLEIPHLVLGGLGKAGKINDAESTYEKWLDVVDKCQSLEGEGMSPSMAQVMAGEAIGIDVVGHFGEMQRFANKFATAVELREPVLFERALNRVEEYDPGEELGELFESEDWKPVLRQCFAEIQAEIKCGYDPRSEDRHLMG